MGSRHSLAYEWPGNLAQVPVPHGGLHSLMCTIDGLYLLDQGSPNFFFQGPDSKYFWLCDHTVSRLYSAIIV